ncbi:MAG: hypothetical protein AAGF12_20475 [Myxococcota bacterium]
MIPLRILLLAAVGVCVFGGHARADDLAVHIETPHAGIVPGPTVWLTAAVSDPEAETAVLVSNGATYNVPIEQGRIRQQLVAVPGNNRVAVVVTHEGQVARDSLTFRYRGEPVELAVLLSWPSDGEIVDLWVREPSGETCKWDHRYNQSGGRLLDFSSDAIGFGSQAFVLPEVSEGSFRIKVHYWGAFGRNDQRPMHDYHSRLRVLDDAEEALQNAQPGVQRRRQAAVDEARAALDAWAAPAAPQTPVVAEVVLFPGTIHERRWRFERTVQRVGQLLTLGEVEVSDAMIANARRDQGEE